MCDAILNVAIACVADQFPEEIIHASSMNDRDMMTWFHMSCGHLGPYTKKDVRKALQEEAIQIQNQRVKYEK